MPTIELPQRCDRLAAVALYPEFLEAMGDAPICVDGSRVERLGLAVTQLLVSADRSAGGIALANPSPQLRATLHLARLEALLAEGDRG